VCGVGVVISEAFLSFKKFFTNTSQQKETTKNIYGGFAVLHLLFMAIFLRHKYIY